MTYQGFSRGLAAAGLIGIGIWGHTGPDVKMGKLYTVKQADLWFQEDVAEAVSVAVSLPKLTQSMFDALVSLIYNVGPGCVDCDSTIGGALRRGDYFTAWAGFALWRKQKGKDVLGLARRRVQEMSLFLDDGIPGKGK